MLPCEVEQGETIFKQGDKGYLFFVIAQGSFELYIDGSFKKFIVREDSFGEYALLYNSPRSGTLKCNSKALLWCLDYETFVASIEETMGKDFEMNKRFLENWIVHGCYLIFMCDFISHFIPSC